MLRSIGPTELIIILAIIVLLFGASRVGDLGKGIGRSIRDFRKEMREGQEEDKAKTVKSERVEEEKTYVANPPAQEGKNAPRH